MENLNIYLSMVDEYLGNVSATVKEVYLTPPQTPESTVDEINIAEPTAKEIYNSSSIFQKRKYSPYKRISHFREHINRINFTQSVTLPQECLTLVNQWANEQSIPKSKLFWKDNIYDLLKGLLAKKFKSKCIEYIPYIINLHRRNKNVFLLTVNYSDYETMCNSFKAIEKIYIRKQSQYVFNRKRRFISYYIIIQCLFTIFHTHPSYTLPTLKNTISKSFFYNHVFKLIRESPSLCNYLKATYMERLSKCKVCNKKSTFFKKTYGMDKSVKKYMYRHMFKA